jgi:hypothetical protein
MRLNTELVDEWNDDACLGTRDAFVAWQARHGLEALVQCGVSYEWWLADKLERNAVAAQSKADCEAELRARGWFKLDDGSWKRERPKPITASGSFEYHADGAS